MKNIKLEKITKINLIKNKKVFATITDDGKITTINCDVDNPYVVSYKCTMDELKKHFEKYGNNPDFFSMHWIGGTYHFLSEELDEDKFNDYIKEFDIDTSYPYIEMSDAINIVQPYCTEENKMWEAVKKLSSFRKYDEGYLKSLEILESVFKGE